MLEREYKWNPYADSNDVDALLTDVAGMAPMYDENGGLLFVASGSDFQKRGGSLSCDEKGHFFKFVDRANFDEEMWAFRFNKYASAKARTPIVPSRIYGSILAAAPGLYLEAKRICQTICRGGKACKICGLKKYLDAMESYNR